MLRLRGSGVTPTREIFLMLEEIVVLLLLINKLPVINRNNFSNRVTLQIWFSNSAGNFLHIPFISSCQKNSLYERITRHATWQVDCKSNVLTRCQCFPTTDDFVSLVYSDVFCLSMTDYSVTMLPYNWQILSVPLSEAQPGCIAVHCMLGFRVNFKWSTSCCSMLSTAANMH